MKTLKLIIVCLLLGVCGVGNSWADGGRHGRHHGHHGSFGVYIGPSWGPSYYQPFPYYYPSYYPPVVVERPAPQVYIEQQVAPPPAAPTTNYWYYCAATRAYYPYVKECSSGWQQVSPQPPGQ